MLAVELAKMNSDTDRQNSCWSFCDGLYNV